MPAGGRCGSLALSPPWLCRQEPGAGAPLRRAGLRRVCLPAFLAHDLLTCGWRQMVAVTPFCPVLFWTVHVFFFTRRNVWSNKVSLKFFFVSARRKYSRLLVCSHSQLLCSCQFLLSSSSSRVFVSHHLIFSIFNQKHVFTNESNRTSDKRGRLYPFSFHSQSFPWRHILVTVLILGLSFLTSLLLDDTQLQTLSMGRRRSS